VQPQQQAAPSVNNVQHVVHIPHGVIGVRSANIMFQFIFGLVVFIPSTALTIYFLIVDPVIGIFFILLDIYSVGLFIYFTVVLAKSPRNRIEFDGQTVTVHVDRNRTVQLQPSDIVATSGRNGNYFLSSWWFIQDGTVTISTASETFRLTFIRQSIAVHHQLEALRMMGANAQ